MIKSTRFAAVVLLALFAPLAQGAADIPGSRDHPLLTRYPDSHIAEYSKAFNATGFKVGEQGTEPRSETIEGDTTTLRYFYNSADTQPSPLQLIRNVQGAIKAIGGSVLYERSPTDMDGGETTLKVTTGGKDFWIKAIPDIYGSPTQNYQLVITEVAAMQQLISANQLLDELNRNGFVALYINFDTGKAELKDDGVATVGEIVAMMQASPELKLSIEGHTDDVGNPAANQQLSEARAQSVVRAVSAGGVAGSRLRAVGYGQTKPVADNRSEAGRAKNRRVELVRLP